MEILGSYLITLVLFWGNPVALLGSPSDLWDFCAVVCARSVSERAHRRGARGSLQGAGGAGGAEGQQLHLPGPRAAEPKSFRGFTDGAVCQSGPPPNPNFFGWSIPWGVPLKYLKSGTIKRTQDCEAGGLFIS